MGAQVQPLSEVWHPLSELASLTRTPNYATLIYILLVLLRVLTTRYLPTWLVYCLLPVPVRFSLSFPPVACMLFHALSCAVMLYHALSCSIARCHALSCSFMHHETGCGGWVSRQVIRKVSKLWFTSSGSSLYAVLGLNHRLDRGVDSSSPI